MHSMKCPECDFESADGAAECPACGLIFDRWKERPAPKPAPQPVPEPVREETPEEDVPNAAEADPAPPVEAPASTQEKPSAPIHKKKFNPFLPALIVVALLLAFFTYRHFSANTPAPAPDVTIAVPKLAAATPTGTATDTPTSTPTGVPTDTPTFSPTPTKTHTKIPTPVPTHTPVPASAPAAATGGGSAVDDMDPTK